MLYKILRTEGHIVNHKRIRRIYQTCGLTLRRKLRRRLPPRHKVTGQAQRLGEGWSVDFVHDALIDGRTFRVFTVIDDATRLALATVVDLALPSARVIRELDQLCEVYGPPRAIRSDNGPEFLAHNVQMWAQRRGIEWRFIQPGKPAQNAIVERFNGTLRREALAASLFPSVAEAQRLIDEMRHAYNTKRPHSSLGGKTPAAFAGHSLVISGLA